MDLFIHTLTGTTFELRVSPFETILSIKSKVQRLEGISICQQHLVWRSMELEDDYCLHDYGIKSGATLTLVLAMRDGPINMRRVSLDEPSLQEMAEYMDENRDELWDKLLNDDKQVTLLVYREGDQLNFFRVYDRGDGTMSPYTDSLSAGSAYNGHEDESLPICKDKQKENLVTRDKMRFLRQKIAAKGARKVAGMVHPARPPSPVRPSANLTRRRIQFANQSSRDLSSQTSSQPILLAKQYSRDLSSQISTPPNGSNQSINIQITPSPVKIESLPPDQQVDFMKTNGFPPIANKGTSINDLNPSERTLNHTEDKELNNLSKSKVKSNTSLAYADGYNSTNSCLRSNHHLPTLNTHSGHSKQKTQKIDVNKSATKHRSLKPLKSIGKNSSNSLLHTSLSSNKATTSDCLLPRIEPSSVVSSDSFMDRQLDDTLKNSQLPDLLRDPVEYKNYKNLLNWVHPKKEHLEKLSMKNFKGSAVGESGSGSGVKPPLETSSSKQRSAKLHVQANLSHLPPLHNDKRSVPTLTGKKKIRCSICTKKLGLATTYQCRCGIKFCAKHRYPEAHTCTYDYKTEGRRLLERSNPVVTAPKLPKI